MSDPINVGINGCGRIGSLVIRTIMERHEDSLELVAVNDIGSIEDIANLIKFDSTYGPLGDDVAVEGDILVIGKKRVKCFSSSKPGEIPWGDLGVQIVIESTGLFTDADLARNHIRDSVKKVIISAPAKNEDVTLVLGVNAEKYDPAVHHVISNASCTTNGLAPVIKVLVENGFVRGHMTTVHSVTNSQQILDKVARGDQREMRGGTFNIVPLPTGAAKALKLVIPEVEGKLDGHAYRVPTPTVSIVEVVAEMNHDVDAPQVNAWMQYAANGSMKGILGITRDPVVSMDMKGETRSSIVDGKLTNVVDNRTVTVAAWYDNEWGYACRISDLADFLAGKGL